MEELRRLTAELKTALTAKIASLDHLRSLLLPPLAFLELTSETPSRNAAWSNLPSELRMSFVQRYLPAVQLLLLQNVYFDWHEQLQAEDEFDQIFLPWFCPARNSRASVECQVHMALAAYGTILSVLTPTSNMVHSVPLNTHIFSGSCSLISGISSTYSLETIFSAVMQDDASGIKKRSTWTQTIQTLFSIPAKVSNASSKIQGTHVPEDLQWSAYMTNLATHFDQLLASLSLTNVNSSISSLAELLAKFSRVGFLNTHRLGDSVTSFWNVVLPKLWPRISSDSQYGSLWRNLLADLPQSDLSSFAASLCLYIDSKESTLPFNHIKPFSSQIEDVQRIKAVSNLLHRLFGSIEESAEGEMGRTVLRRCFLQREGWQIHWARVVVCWASYSSTSFNSKGGF